MTHKIITFSAMARAMLVILTLVSTEAVAQTQPVELFNFTAGSYESVLPDHLTAESAQHYLPQYENAVAIFEHFTSLGHTPAEALNLTYDAIITAVTQLEQDSSTDP